MKRIREWLAVWFRQDEWPFMLFLTVVLFFIYFASLFESQQLRNPLMLLLFTAIFLAHLILHWANIYWLQKRWNVVLYLGIQSALIFCLVTISGSWGPLIGLYLGMIGQAAGLLRTPWKIAVAVVVFLGLSALNYSLLAGGLFFGWWIVALFPTTFFVIVYVLLYMRQADAREKAQKLLAELDAANRQLTEYADRIEDLTLAAERQRMARELHDTLAQGLAGLILQLEAADSHLSSNRSERAQEIIEQAMKRARSTLAESRKAIDNLRSGDLRFGSLAEALQAEIDHFQSVAGFSCVTQLDLPEWLSESESDLIFRSVAEGLSNIARHAKAHSAKCSIELREGNILVSIQDDGIGFDPERIPTGHYGLLGLRERVRQANGSVEIESTPGKGATLRVTIPALVPQ